MSPPSVTLAVMTCNQADFLAASLESALAQDHRPLRLQIFDNGSQDATPAIIAAFHNRQVAGVAIESHRFDYLGGPAALLNAMAPMLRDDLVVLQAGDDLAEVARVRRLLPLFAADPAVLLAHSAVRVIDAEGRLLERIDYPPPPPAAQAAHYGRVQGHVLGAGLAIHRRLLSLFPPLDDRAFEDQQLPFRAALAGRIAYAPEPLLRYRRHAGNVTHALHSLASPAATRAARGAALLRLEALAEIRSGDLAYHLTTRPEQAGRLAALPQVIADSLALARDETALWDAMPGRRFAAWWRLRARQGSGLRALATTALTALWPALALYRRRRAQRRRWRAAPRR